MSSGKQSESMLELSRRKEMAREKQAV